MDDSEYLESDSCSASTGSAYYADYEEESAVEGCDSGDEGEGSSGDAGIDRYDDDSDDYDDSDDFDEGYDDSDGSEATDDSNESTDIDWDADSESSSLHPRTLEPSKKAAAKAPRAAHRTTGTPPHAPVKKRSTSPISRMALLFGGSLFPSGAVAEPPVTSS